MSKKATDPAVGHDILCRYLAGGVWKRRIIDKLGKGRSEKTKVARLYTAIPPSTGWPGGNPLDNGWKPRGGK